MIHLVVVHLFILMTSLKLRMQYIHVFQQGIKRNYLIKGAQMSKIECMRSYTLYLGIENVDVLLI